MATGLDIVTGALKLLGINPAETPLSPGETEDGRKSLNDMMNEWEDGGLQTGFVPLEDINTEISVDASLVGPIKALLAEYVAPEYDRLITPTLDRRIRMARQFLQTVVQAQSEMGLPDTLPMGSGNEYRQPTNNGDIPGNSVGNRFYPTNDKRNF